jgi:hypothetical protein
MPEIYLYAELLIHIRQLTLHASLETEKNEHTKIFLSSDKKIVTALHEGENASIYLPTQISGTANVTFPLKRRTELSTKLQIEDLHQLELAFEASSDIEVPWPASRLTNQTSVLCRECSNVVVKSDTVKEWKDLPNENWADLMDMWFCHKPHDHHENEEEAAESKGFSSKSKLQVASGVGFVDLLSFLLDPTDCSDIEVSASLSFSSGNKERDLPVSHEILLARDLIQLPNIESISYQSDFRNLCCQMVRSVESERRSLYFTFAALCYCYQRDYHETHTLTSISSLKRKRKYRR